MSKIPKIAHFYWGNKVMPFLRYMTLHSFIKLNPDWKVILYIPAQIVETKTWKTAEQKYDIVSEDYFSSLSNLPIEIKKFDLEDIGLENNLPEVIKSDLIRWHLLSKIGGLWSDMDIAYIKPLDCSILDKYDTCLCYNGYFSIGFLLSSQDNELFSDANVYCKRYLDTDHYQSAGSTFLSIKFKDINTIRAKYKKLKIYNIPMSLVYSLDSSQVDKIFNNSAGLFCEETIGIHWYAGHPIAGKYQNIINSNNFNQYPSSVTRAISITFK